MKENKSITNSKYTYIGISIVFYYLVWSVVAYFFKDILNPTTQSFKSVIKLFILMTVSSFMTLFYPCIKFTRDRSLDFRKTFMLNSTSQNQFILSTIIFISFNGIAAFLLLTQDIILNKIGIQFEMNDYMISENILAVVVLVLTVGILIPFGEELFFRGFLIKGMESISENLAIIVSAFYFAIIHSNPHRFITLVLFGAIFGLIVKYTNSIIPGVILHTLNNSVFEIYTYSQGKSAMLIQYKDISSSPVNIMDNYSYLFSVFLFSSIACILSLRKLKEISNIPKYSSDKIYDGDKTKGIITILLALAFSMGIFLFRVT